MGLADRFLSAFRAFRNPAGGGPRSGPGDPSRLSPTDRGMMLGHGPGVLTSDHFNELNHFKSWVFVGVDAIGKQWEQAEWAVYDTSWQAKRGLVKSAARIGSAARRKAFDSPAEKRTPADGHPVARLLKRPNPFKSRREFMYQVAVQMRLTGACLIWDVRDQFGEPCELWVIPRGWLWPQPPTVSHPFGGWRVQPILGGGAGWYQGLPGKMAGGFFLDWRDTIQVGRAHPLYPGEAMSPLEACSQLLDIMFQVDTATWASFVNAPKPSALVSIVDGTGQASQPVTPEQIDQVKAQMVAMYAGASNAGKFLVGNNVAYQALQTGPAELDYVNGRDQNMSNALAIQGVPPIAIGKDSDGTYSGSAAKLNQFVELVVQPDLSLFADKVTNRYQPLYGDDFEVEGNAHRCDDPDLNIRKAQLFATFYGMRRGDVRVTENEARSQIGLEPIDGGDELPERMPGPQEQAAMQAAAGPPGPAAAPDAGAPPGAAPADDGADAESFDLEPSLPDDTSTGVADPSRRAAPKAKAILADRLHLRNGTGGGH